MALSPMNVVARRAMAPGKSPVLLAIAEPFAARLAREMGALAVAAPVAIASTYIHLRELASRFPPQVILLSHEILDGVPFLESLHQFAELAPIVLVAPAAVQPKIARLAAAGSLDFVAREGDFLPLASALLERRVSWARQSDPALSQIAMGWEGDIGEMFRHEINNPLTGILGNAELLLAHRDHLSAADTNRIQTVVDLAVRLRETIRRLSNAFEAAAPKPA